ncbi:MAG: stage II sporulation protein P [Clostridia bacterium]|nr:stage II sporulation protein P [Clostridia bacterium]
MKRVFLRIFDFFKVNRGNFLMLSTLLMSLCVFLCSFLMGAYNVFLPKNFAHFVKNIYFGNDAEFIMTAIETSIGRSVVIKKAETQKRTNKGRIRAILPDISQPIEDNIGEDFDIYAYDLSLVPQGAHPIIPKNLCYRENGVFVYNQTSYDVDISQSASANISKKDGSADGPLVLIYHTHGTEAFSNEGAYYSEDDDSVRSCDIEKNIVSVGQSIADTLTENGIEVLHLCDMFDKDSFANAYEYSCSAVLDALKKYPSIKYVLDIHRDAIEGENGEIIKPVCLSNGKRCAQIMFVVGTDEAGSDHHDWQKNFSLALAWQSKLFEMYGDIARPINLRDASFNQQYSKGALLLEIGASGNTLSEAKEAGVCVAKALTELIYQE